MFELSSAKYFGIHQTFSAQASRISRVTSKHPPEKEMGSSEFI